MSRRPDAPCSGCGNLIWRGSTSLPAGEAKCRPCRRNADWSHGTRDGYRKNACRCAECKAWNAAQVRDYSRSRRASGNPLPRRGWIPASLRALVYERDAWMCGICIEPVDPDAHWNDDWAPSLDHIIPKSWGGSDSIDNLRLAHRWCNTVRSDERRYSDDDFRSPLAS